MILTSNDIRCSFDFNVMIIWVGKLSMQIKGQNIIGETIHDRFSFQSWVFQTTFFWPE